MLDTITKRRIDTARDILVGKVPDPKSQVEQITIALIYKFMDDMDAEAEELGGKRQFFDGDFTRYRWAKLLRSGLGGHEMLGLYAEAITRMPENPGIPLLFRDIFKNAYLPYRDPETLRAFLRIIDEFEYDHSERLGDAFEYLLSVLGSQGDAGQFRTPRHIIDFIVAVLDPKKDESILDPACGTAGFLISAYKHILNANKDAAGHSTLTPDDRARMARNLRGYDISPDMVRLSLVNLYLHGFTDPHIEEYDTLTSEEKWNDYADVILANPPFMSPKGGIKPHRRFSVQSKRSEVLFVDYMAEHLTPKGRAGIIVPEGIIFQSQGAYTELRRMLVEHYLVAVISLPAGVFNPYSGVKTSILILDKALARQSNTVSFFKIDADGFGLGAQRRATEKNDLPAVQQALAAYLACLRSGGGLDDFAPLHGLIVEKEKIAVGGDYNLSMERYRDGVVANSSWPFVPVAEVFRKSELTVMPDTLSGPITYIGLENITQGTGEITGNVVAENPDNVKSLKCVFKTGGILYGKLRPNLNKVWLADRPGICSTDIFVIEAIAEKAVAAFYAYLLRTKRFNDAVMSQIRGAQLPRIGWSSFAELEIPLPPLEVQQEIVAEIEGYQKVIDGARAVVEHYKPQIPVNPQWPMQELSEITEVTSSKRILAEEYVISGIPFYRTKEIVELNKGREISLELFISNARYQAIKERFGSPIKGDVLISAVGTIGISWVVADNREFYFKDGNLIWIRDFKDLNPYFLKYCLDKIFISGKEKFAFGAAYSALTIEKLKQFKIPLPSLPIQQSIVSEIEAEQQLVSANRELITRFEKKIQATLARVWGEAEVEKAALDEARSEQVLIAS